MVGRSTQAQTKPNMAIRIVEIARPLVLLGGFVIVEQRFGWMWAAPFALAAVLAASVLVHDLIHNALDLPPRLNDFLLGFYALFLIKSGHALRRLHLEHHARCLEDDDREGNVIYIPTWKLLVTGPFLALQARFLSWRAEKRRRWAQAIESLLNIVITAALAGAAWFWREPAPAVYLATVIGITVTVPILGAKVPHVLPERWPKLVAALRPWTSRLTPAASSLLFHELHHRRPRIPAAQLKENEVLLDTTEASNCAKHYAANEEG